MINPIIIHLSYIQLRHSFVLLVTTWNILCMLLNVKLSYLKKFVHDVCRLQNICINSRESSVKVNHMYKVPDNMMQLRDPSQLHLNNNLMISNTITTGF